MKEEKDTNPVQNSGNSVEHLESNHLNTSLALPDTIKRLDYPAVVTN